MKLVLPTLLLLLAPRAFSSTAHADEILCREAAAVAEPGQSELAGQFDAIAIQAARWTFARPVPRACRKALDGPEALYEATFRYHVQFVTERLHLCDSVTRIPTRIVDAVNDRASGLVQIWDHAWQEAEDYERQLITTHELAGIAGKKNEPWTTSICWMFVPLLPGTKVAPFARAPLPLRRLPILIAGEGGSTGGRGGGDIKMAGYKFRALLTMLDTKPFAALGSCGLTPKEFDRAFSGWLSEEVTSPDAWKATSLEIVLHSFELGKKRRAPLFGEERACIENKIK
jgi:hypothetical protein